MLTNEGQSELEKIFLKELLKQAPPGDHGAISVFMIVDTFRRMVTEWGRNPTHLRIHPDTFEEIFNTLPQMKVFGGHLPIRFNYSFMGMTVILDESLPKNQAQLLCGYRNFVLYPPADVWKCAVCGEVTSTPHEHSIEDQEGQ